MNEREKMEKLKQEITLTDTVNQKMEDAYASIRVQAASQTQDRTKVVKFGMMKQKRTMFIAAAVLTAALGTVGVAAANGYFTQKEVTKADGSSSYVLNLNYDLKPGRFAVACDYLPEDYVRDEAEYSEDRQVYIRNNDRNDVIEVMPITLSDMDKWWDNHITILKNDKVEEAVLSGMKANVITGQSGTKQIYLFNEQEGCVIWLWADQKASMDELKKVADHLSVTRIGDAEYESEEEREQRLAEAAQQQALDAQIERLNARGVPAENLVDVGEPLVINHYSNNLENEDRLSDLAEEISFTVLDAAVSDALPEAFSTDMIYDKEELENALNPDGTLRSRTAKIYDENGEEIGEEEVAQKFMTVKLRCDYVWRQSVADEAGAQKDRTALDGRLIWLSDEADGYYPADASIEKRGHGQLQIDHMCIGMNVDKDSDFVDENDEAHQFFWRNLENGDSVEYTLLFVIDADCADLSKMVLDMNASGGQEMYEGSYLKLN